ncbi:hypothetical protein BGZ83_009111 [Gryganskiella cystojenkinii]|nr:hypothetical protein BGZ83_009111 [Gryganskiella cystojenkinii]
MDNMEPVVNSTEFCDWRVQSQGNCMGVTYVSFLYTTHIISSFLFLFISVGILIHNIWWKGQKIWEFSRNDRAFRPRPTEGFVFWCTGYFFFRCVLSVLLLVGVNEGKRGLLENFADLPWVFVSGAMGFYLVGIIYATPASFSTHNGFSSKKRRSTQNDNFNNNAIQINNDMGRFSSMMEPKRVYLPTPMVLNFTLLGLTVLPLIANQILASFAGAAFDRDDMDVYNNLIAAMYGVWAFVVAIIFVLYLFFGKQLLTIISSNMASINDNVGRVSSRIGADSEYTDRDDNERQLNNLKSTYQRMRAILVLCGSLSAIMGFMMLFFAIYRRQILNDNTASETFALIWIHGASVALGCSLIFILFRKAYIIANSTLRTLNLDDNTIRDKEAQALSKALKINSTLTTFTLSGNLIGDIGVQALSEALKTNSTLTILDLKRNRIRDAGAQAMSKALKTNSTLAILDLSSNSIGHTGAQALYDTLKTNSTLTTLTLSYNKIGPSGAQALSEELKTNSTFATVNLAGNSIGDIGAQALSEALKTNSILTILDLQRNLIGDAGAQALSDALKTNSTLTTLTLSYNQIGPNGALALSDALKTNSTLTTLTLWQNRIGSNGAQALSEALKTNSTLTTLWLVSNSIRDIGAQALCEALQTNSTLTTLWLGDNWIGEIGAQAMRQLHYFPIHGIGSTSRALLSISGVKWIDKIQPFEEWKKVKATTPFGFLPILTVRDPEGKTVVEFPEADVIERYLGKKLGFFGSTPEEELEIEILLNQTITLQNIWVFRVVPAKDAVREEVLQAFLDWSLQFWITNCEKHLKAKAETDGGGLNGHFVGGEISIVDIKAAVLMDILLSIPGSDKTLNAEKAPGLWKIKETVDLIPAYAAYRQSNAFGHHDVLQKEKVVPKFEGFDMKKAHFFS